MGLLDFAGALTTGILYIGPFAAQVAASGVSPPYVNYVLIVPSFGVPLYTLLHIYSLFQLVSAHLGKPTPGLEAPRHPPVFSAEVRLMNGLFGRASSIASATAPVVTEQDVTGSRYMPNACISSRGS